MSLLQLVHKNSLRRRETENANLKIALFGATGKTGIYFLQFALEKGNLKVNNSSSCLIFYLFRTSN